MTRHCYWRWTLACKGRLLKTPEIHRLLFQTRREALAYKREHLPAGWIAVKASVWV